MRIRSIKPEFWRSDDIDALSWDDRLIFIGLWSYVDDNGVGLDKLSAIASDLFSHDLSRDSTETLRKVSTALVRFAKADLITRYEVGGKRYLHITTWDSHQRVQNPNKERYPLPTSAYVETQESLVTPSGDPIEELSPGAVEQRNRGTEEQRLKTRSPQAAPEPDLFPAFWDAYPRKVKRAESEKAFKAARKRAPGVDLVAAAQRLAADPNLPAVQFIPHPPTWLNNDRWNDPPCPQRDGGPPQQVNRATARTEQDFQTMARLAAADRQNGHEPRIAIGAR